MINQTLFSGINLQSENTKYFNNFAGISLQSENTKYVNDFAGITFNSEYNLTFTIFDGLTLQPITANILFEDLTNPNDIFTNGSSNQDAHIHKLLFTPNRFVGYFIDYKITVAKNNYQTLVNTYHWDIAQQRTFDIVVYLYPVTTEPLGCDSFISNETGLRLSKMILGQKNYISCNFTLSDFTSENEYFVAFTQSLATGNKFNMKELQATYIGLVGANLHQWRAEIPNPQNGVYFTSSIRKKI